MKMIKEIIMISTEIILILLVMHKRYANLPERVI